MISILPFQRSKCKPFSCANNRTRKVLSANRIVTVAVELKKLACKTAAVRVSEGTLAVADTGSGGVGYYSDQTKNSEHTLNDLDGATFADGRNDIQQFEQTVDESDEKGSEGSQPELVLQANLPVDLCGRFIGGVSGCSVHGVTHSDFLHSFDCQIKYWLVDEWC